MSYALYRFHSTGTKDYFTYCARMFLSQIEQQKQRSETSKLATTCNSAGCLGLKANEETDGTTTTNYIAKCLRSIIRLIVREAKLGGFFKFFLGC